MTTTRFALAMVLLGLAVPPVALAQGRGAPGLFPPADPTLTRLFFGPTARTLPRGQVNLSVYEIVLPTLQVGVTDRFSLGGGTPLIPGLGSERPAWVTSKLQLNSSQRVAVAVGAIRIFVPGWDPDIAVAYGNATCGTPDSALTVGAGYAYNTGHAHTGGALAMIGGEHRASPGVKFITENYLWRGGALVSGGVRYLSNRVSLDSGIAVLLYAGEAYSVPFVNFVWMIH